MKRKDSGQDQYDVVWYILILSFLVLFEKISLGSKRKVKFAKSNEEIHNHHKSNYFKTCHVVGNSYPFLINC